MLTHKGRSVYSCSERSQSKVGEGPTGCTTLTPSSFFRRSVFCRTNWPETAKGNEVACLWSFSSQAHSWCFTVVKTKNDGSSVMEREVPTPCLFSHLLMDNTVPESWRFCHICILWEKPGSYNLQPCLFVFFQPIIYWSYFFTFEFICRLRRCLKIYLYISLCGFVWVFTQLVLSMFFRIAPLNSHYSYSCFTAVNRDRVFCGGR